MYARRDHYTRATLSAASTAHHVALEPPVMQRRSSLRPRSATMATVTKEMSALRNETHPIMHHVPSVLVNACTAEESQRGTKTKSLHLGDDGVVGGGADTSPHGTLTAGEARHAATTRQNTRDRPQAKGIFPQFGKLFDKSEGKLEQLTEQLNSYSLQMPAMPELLALGKPDFPEDLFHLESHWSHLMDVDIKEVSKRQKDQQEAVWELIHTEVEFIRRLKVIIDLFQCVLLNLQNELLLNEIETEKVFGNVSDVYAANATFWQKALLPVVKQSRQTRHFLDPSLLKQGFMQFEEMMHPYTKYCLEQKSCLEYIKVKEKENDLFKTFIQWGESQSDCNRLKLQDLIISPMQRLTKYKLLLKAVLKKTEEEETRKDLITMIERVDRFVRQVNSVMHQKAEQERLSVIIDRIEAYDVIDTPNEECMKLSSEYCKFDLTCPVPGCGPQQKRHLLLEGGLKLKDAYSKMDVYCFLFTDMLLVTKPNRRGDKVKVTKPPMRLDKVVVTLLRDTVSFMLVYLNEYNVASSVYTFHGDSAKVWVDHVKRSQDAYRSMRSAAMSHTETRLMYLDMYDDTYEEDYAIFSATGAHRGSNLDLSPVPFDRMDSHGSADTFMPNLDQQLSRSTSHDAIRHLTVAPPTADGERHSRLAPSTSLDESVSGGGGGGGRPGGGKHLTLAEQRSRSPRPNLTLPRSGSASDDVNSTSPLSPGGVEGGYSKSAGLHPEHAFFEGKPPIKAKPALPPRPPGMGSRGGEEEGVGGGGGRGVSKTYSLPSHPEYEENLRSKLSQRRNTREKRYHTADAIQELQKEPDASIHKRLSWNFGTTAVDINIEDRGVGSMRGGSQTFSSDSLRSMPSSSGVSSTGSLHLSPDTEISEEYENDQGELVQGMRYSHSDQILSMNTGTNVTESSTDDIVDTGGHMRNRGVRWEGGNEDMPPPLPTTEPPDLNDEGLGNNSLSTSMYEQPGGRDGPIGSEESHDQSHDQLLEQTTKFSKSLPNISVIKTEVKDGIGSIEVMGVDGQKRKMTHGEILRMKTQFLLNSTLEASDV